MKRAKKKRSLRTIHAALRQAWGRLERARGWELGKIARLRGRIRALEREQARALGRPLLPGEG